LAGGDAGSGHCGFCGSGPGGILARKNPEGYGLKPFGLTAGGAAAKEEYNWSIKEAFSNFAIWGTILAFLTSMLAEFLIWTQVVRFWTEDAKLSLSSATNLYVAIGLAGIVTMPLTAASADAANIKGKQAGLPTDDDDHCPLGESG